jgi:membrane protease YdiL (CAAX protease family)
MIDNTATANVLAFRPATRFLALVFGSTWLLQLPMLLAQRGVIAGPAERFMPLVVLGFFAPCLIAVLLSALEAGWHGVRSLLAPLAIARVSLGWYALSLSLPCAIFLGARAALAPWGHELGPWFYPPTQPQQLAALLIIPFTEQIPWRGYLYTRLQQAQKPLLASVVTGSAWALFHVQKHAFIDPHASLALALLSIVYMSAGTVVFSWIYLRSGGSMLLVVVAHVGLYLNNPSQAFPNLVPLALHTLGFCVVAVALALGDREVWRSPSASPLTLESS